MNRQQILEAINDERAYQDALRGPKFDDKNTANDWASYITSYVSEAVKFQKTDGQFNLERFQTKLLKAITIGVACLESVERNGGLPKRHYD